jgi:hypothetical protein
MTPRKAFDAIRSAGLMPVLLGMPTLKSEGFSSYVVAAQEPEPGTVTDGRVVIALEITATFGYPIDGPFVAPAGTVATSVVGLDLEEAMGRVTSAGLIAVCLQPHRAVEDLAIKRQDPEAGALPNPWREVALFLD